MKSNKFFLVAITILCVLPTFFSCKKTVTPEQIGINRGQTIVKIVTTNPYADTVGTTASPDYQALALSISSTPVLIEFLEIRRDAATPDDLNTSLIVKVKDDPGVLNTLGNQSNNVISSLPDSAYTVDPSNPKIGNEYTITFAPGEFARTLKIYLKTSSLVLGTRSGLGFTISSIEGIGKISSNFVSKGVEISLKNQWDGNYRSAYGYFYHPTVPRAIPANTPKTCSTSGVNSVVTELGDFNGVAQPSYLYATLTIDNANNVTISPGTAPTQAALTTLTTLPASNPGYLPFAGSNPALYNNTYDPVSKTFYLRYGYTNAAGLWRVIEEVLIKN